MEPVTSSAKESLPLKVAPTGVIPFQVGYPVHDLGTVYLVINVFFPTRYVAPYGKVQKWVYYIMFLRQWPTEDFGTFIDYFQRHFAILDVVAAINFVEGGTSVLQSASKVIEVPAGMTRKMFTPLSLTLFGTNDYVTDIEQWLPSKLRKKA